MTDLARKPFVSKAPRLGFVSSFDGIRGIGVMMVLVQHAYPTAESMSSIVDVFFIISGFLITTLLIEEHHRSGRISLRNFYIRRGLRLLPALIVVLGVGFAIIAVAIPALRRQAGLESLAALFYTHNIFYPPIEGFAQVLGQMWSLSVEEQFYLVVSIVLFLVLPKARVRPLFIVLTAFYVVVNIARLSGSFGPGQAWFHRPDACALGMMLAFVNAWIPPLGPRWRRPLRIAGAVSLVVIVLCFAASSELLRNDLGVDFGVPFMPEIPRHTQDAIAAAADAGDSGAVSRLARAAVQDSLGRLDQQWYWVRWGFTVSGLACAVGVFVLVRLREDWGASRFFSIGVIAFIGRASYALYISHYQLYLIIDPVLVGGPKVRAVERILVALAVGIALHVWIEKPALRMKDRFSALGTR